MMSGGSKQQYKQFNISSVQNACLVLGELISGVIVNLEKYKEYTAELEALLEKTDSEYVQAKQYDDIHDKLLFRQREILRFAADHQSSSFSYSNLRKILEKKQYLVSRLPEDVVEILSELLDVRNWSFHNPQSMMVAAKEATEKNIPDELKGIATITPQINPVIIQKTDRYEIIMLASLTIHAGKRIEQFKKVLTCMKSDYQEMYDSIEDKPLLMTPNGLSSEVKYIEMYRTGGLTDYGSDIAQLSMAIQKSKYDGSDEKFREWVVRFEESNPSE